MYYDQCEKDPIPKGRNCARPIGLEDFLISAVKWQLFLSGDLNLGNEKYQAGVLMRCWRANIPQAILKALLLVDDGRGLSQVYPLLIMAN